MKQFLLFLAIACTSFQTYGQKSNTQVERPKLVVGIVVDQMRWDYLYRYYERYSNDGFKRLLNGGYNCQNAMINYLPSYTAPGHSCVYTGTVPSIHGIAANDWVDKLNWQHHYCTDDTSVSLVGDAGKQPSMSPRNLLVSTITDELRLATNFKSRVYGVAIKDRGSILPAGHLANAAYWYDDRTGNFTTSTYYTQQLPQWLQSFNNRKLADSLVKQNWQTLYPINTYTQSVADNNAYEKGFKGEATPTFPHMMDKLNDAARYSIIKALPAGNTLTAMMAEACIAGEQLGRSTTTDFLAVSFSSTDYVGHQYAPNSIEVEDTYLRLDAELAAFLKYLDKEVGNGNYLLFLTADHGAAHNITFLQDHNVPAGSFNPELKQLNGMLKSRFGKDSLVLFTLNYQLYLNDKLIPISSPERAQVKAAIREWLNARPEVSYVIDMENINATAVPEPILSMAINGYNKQRSGSILMIPNAGWYEGYGSSATGTTHGTWNPYDTHILLLWYGWHIPRGEKHETVYMTDISATLATLLHIQMPNGCIGKAIEMR